MYVIICNMTIKSGFHFITWPSWSPPPPCMSSCRHWDTGWLHHSHQWRSGQSSMNNMDTISCLVIWGLLVYIIFPFIYSDIIYYLKNRCLTSCHHHHHHHLHLYFPSARRLAWTLSRFSRKCSQDDAMNKHLNLQVFDTEMEDCCFELYFSMI